MVHREASVTGLGNWLLISWPATGVFWGVYWKSSRAPERNLQLLHAQTIYFRARTFWPAITRVRGRTGTAASQVYCKSKNQATRGRARQGARTPRQSVKCLWNFSSPMPAKALESRALVSSLASGVSKGQKAKFSVRFQFSFVFACGWRSDTPSPKIE